MFITLRLMGPLNGSTGCLKHVFRQLRWLINHGNLQSWPCWRAIEQHPMLLWVRPLFCSWEADLWEQSWMFFFLRIARINSFKSELVWNNDRTKVNNTPIVREDLSSLKLQLETRWEWESLFAWKKWEARFTEPLSVQQQTGPSTFILSDGKRWNSARLSLCREREENPAQAEIPERGCAMEDTALSLNMDSRLCDGKMCLIRDK